MTGILGDQPEPALPSALWLPVPLFLGIPIMFGMNSGRPNDFKAVHNRPKSVAIGSCCSAIVPLVAYAWCLMTAPSHCHWRGTEWLLPGQYNFQRNPRFMPSQMWPCQNIHDHGQYPANSCA